MNPTSNELTALQTEWQTLQPLTTEHQDRLWQKLRLEWNYHSNHIEGNTLTYGETMLLLLHDRTSGNHSTREYLEMKAHDVAIEHVRTLAADPIRIITETDIRDLNRIILKESFWKPAETMDGKPSQIEVIPGAYKTLPNNVLTKTGEMFYFASVEDTPPKMQALANWLRQELETPTLHPIALATKLHHDFVLIHPFDDGNGRVARLLVNYVLLRSGYLPVIVRTEDKANYLTALRLADAGDLAPLTDYLARLAEWSMSTGIKAAKGEAIEEPGDVEKELAIFIRNQQEHQDKVKPRSPEAVREIYELGLKNLIEKLTGKMTKLTPLFAEQVITVTPKNTNSKKDPLLIFDEMIPKVNQHHEFTIQFQFRGYRGHAPDPFDFRVSFHVRLLDFQYLVLQDGTQLIKKHYSEPILSDEADAIANQFLSSAFVQIKKLAKQNS